MVKKGVLLFVLLLTCMLFAENGYVQVKCNPNIKIMLDGTLKGVSSSEIGGLIIENVLPGNHTLKAIKEGFKPQTTSIRINSGEVFLWTLEPFIPNIEISQEGDVGESDIKREFGSLLIQSLPVECLITIEGLGINKNSKEQDRWKAEKIPTSKYTVNFIWNNVVLSEDVEIKPDTNTRVFVNFIKKTTDISEDEMNKQESLSMIKASKKSNKRNHNNTWDKNDSISDFSNFLGLSYGDTVDKVFLLFGNNYVLDEETKYDFNVVYYKYNNEYALRISYNKATEKIKTIRAYNPILGFLNSKELWDDKLDFLDKDPTFIEEHLGTCEKKSASRLNYKNDKLLYEFVCYDFHDHKCSEIYVHWFHRD